MGLQTLYPAPDYLKKRQKGLPNPLIYPDINYFPPVFLKIEFFDRKATEIKKGPVETIYLPLPNDTGLLLQDIAPVYSADMQETGLMGEFAIRNYTSIRDGIENIIGSGLNENVVAEEAKDFLKEAGREGISFIKTMLERKMMTGETKSAKAIKQGLGYGFSPNKILNFLGIQVLNTKRLNFSFTPKNINESRKIEKIIKIITKASLPEIKKEAFDKVIKSLADVTINDFLFDITDTEPTFGPRNTTKASIENFYGSVENFLTAGGTFDQRQNLSFSNSRLGTAISELGDVAINDIWEGTKDAYKKIHNDVVKDYNENIEQWFSSTLELPYLMRLSVMKRHNKVNPKTTMGASVSNTESAEEAIELMRFPVGFVITRITVEREPDITNLATMSFIKEGEEYFSGKYFINLEILEERVLTAEDMVDHSNPQGIREKERMKKTGASEAIMKQDLFIPNTF